MVRSFYPWLQCFNKKNYKWQSPLLFPFFFLLGSVSFYQKTLNPGGTVIVLVPTYVGCLWVVGLRNAGLINQLKGKHNLSCFFILLNICFKPVRQNLFLDLQKCRWFWNAPWHHESQLWPLFRERTCFRYFGFHKRGWPVLFNDQRATSTFHPSECSGDAEKKYSVR